jgi:L-fucono-1,5-lactonase
VTSGAAAPVIDAHHHLWDPSRAVYPWMTDDLAAIRRPFGVGDLLPLLDAAGIDATVLVQTRSSLEETREFLAAAAGTSRIAGVVGWVDLTSPAVADDLAALAAGHGGDKLVGIRHQVQDEPDPQWLGRPDVRRGLRAVQDAGLAYDLLVRTRELPAALEAARAFPALGFVIDHLAKPAIGERAWEPWAARLAAFAGMDHVSCKLSGLVTEASWTDWTVADLRPYAAHALETFGAHRLAFGSDWPVSLVAAPYPAVVDAARQLVAGLSADERAAVLGGTAVDVYRLRAAAAER